MHAAFLTVQVLTCLGAVLFYSVYGQSTCCPTANCCNNGCAAPTPFNITLSEFVSLQPFYVNILPAISLFAGVDNICFIYDLLPDGTYLFTFSTVYCNGFNTTQDFIKSQSDVGVFPYGSSVCSAQFTIFDFFQSNNCSLFLGYLCFFYGDCSFAPGDDIPVVGVSTSNKPVSQACLATAVDRISRAGVPDQEYFIVPFNLTTNCQDALNCSSTSS